MARRVLFVIRGKLGDTLVAYATVRSYVDAFPADEVTLLTRSGYAGLLSGEAGLRILGFSSRLGLLFLLLRMRAWPKFDALLVIWGFGSPIRWIGRFVRAERRIYLDDRFRDVFAEYPEPTLHLRQAEPMWKVVRKFEPAFPIPTRLSAPSLASRKAPSPDAIGIVPLADEARRCISPGALRELVDFIARRSVGVPIRIFLNPADRGADALTAAGPPENAEFRFFPELEDLVRELSCLAEVFCTDTGLYHLAAAMGIPATVFFGPTQPNKIIMPFQPGVRGIRLKGLANDHCEEKACGKPVCLDASVWSYAGRALRIDSQETPKRCLLRAIPDDERSVIKWHEDSRNQA